MVVFLNKRTFIEVIGFVYTQPVIGVNEVESIIQKSNVTAYKLIDALVKLDILKDITGSQRNKKYIFSEYLNLFKQEEL